MKKFTLYMGLNDKKTRLQAYSTLEAYKITMNILKAHTDGGTISEADGFYKHEDGTFTIEKTLRIELLFVEKSEVKAIVNALKIAFNQESIAVQEEVIQSELW